MVDNQCFDLQGNFFKPSKLSKLSKPPKPHFHPYLFIFAIAELPNSSSTDGFAMPV